jgi:Hydrophobic surface binding protein A
MYFKIVSTIALVASVAVASPIEVTVLDSLTTFDLPAVQAVFNSVSASIDKMISQVKEFDGDTAKMEPILAASTEIMNGLKEGTQKIASSPAMGIADALGILTPVGAMASKVDEIVTALSAKKDVFEKANIVSVVVQQLQDQRQAADKLAKAITNNLPLPTIIGPLAAPIAKQFTDKLESGIKAFGAEPTELTGSPPAQAAAAPKTAKTPKTSKGKGGKTPGVSRDISIENLMV